MDKNAIQKELATRALAKKSLKHFVLLKWERYELKPFNDNWHFDYLCKILESTLPQAQESVAKNISEPQSQIESNLFDTPATQSTSTESARDDKPLNTPANLCHTERSEVSNCDTENNLCHTEGNARSIYTSSEVSINQAKMFRFTQHDKKEQEAQLSENATETATIRNDFIENFATLQAEQQDNDLYHKDECQPLTRLIINMPPSYGKTEIIARCFMPWALGHFPQRKFFYISYSDDLCRKISNQVRDVLKSPFYASIFGKNPIFLQDNANEFILKEGGGLFVTTLKSALTGFHAHQILIDDPIKVSEMNSKAERDKVNQNFKESVLSRLQDNQSNITILMQRLGDNDLCGFLLDNRNFESEVISQWKQVSLKAINDSKEIYQIGDFYYERPAKTALFNARHTLTELENLKLQMGNDEFSTQYQQDPQVSEAGYFEKVYFKEVPSFECGAQNLFIFVDNAISLNQSADNRAIILIGAEAYKEATRYVVRDCVYGIWSEEETISNLIDIMYNNPSAKVYIESDGGGLIIERLLNAEIVRFNTKAKGEGRNGIINSIKCYTPSRKIAKVEKIKAMRPYYNTGYLVFLHNARGLSQIKKELFSFNPSKPFRKDDCIDAIASAIINEDVRAIMPSKPKQESIRRINSRSFNARRVPWNI